MESLETFLFGDGFRLEVQRDSAGRKLLKLTRKAEEVKDTLRPSLELLHYMIQHPMQDLLQGEILDYLWPGSDVNILEKHISYLRTSLGDDSKDPVYIKTLYKRGYKFLLKVKREGGGIEAYPKWDLARFHQLLRDLRRGPETDREDLRIVATAVSASLDELQIRGLLGKKIRIKILLLNPENESLVHARYALRRDKSPTRCLHELKTQISDLKKYKREYPPSIAKAPENKTPPTVREKGSLDYGLSNIMPPGFLVHTREWALLGIYPAHNSFIEAPMLEMMAGTEPWTVLYKDWNARWANFQRSLRAAVTKGA